MHQWSLEQVSGQTQSIVSDVAAISLIACDCMRSHEIANLMSTTVRVLENASGTRSGTESLPEVFLHDNCEQILCNFFCLSQKGRNEKWDSFYTAKSVSSVHSCRDETRLAVLSVPFPQNKFRTCFFLLWALHFMKVYSKQSPGCSAVGVSAGAVDPKTHRKWVWAFINAVANLVNVVVNNHSVGTGAKMALC